MKKLSLLILCLLYCFSLCSAVSLSNISRRGSYQSDGSYLWTYTVTISTDDSDLKDLELSALTAGQFPFRIEGLPLRSQVSVGEDYLASFGVVVPASYIKEPVDVSTHKMVLKLTVARGSAQTIDVTVRGPLPAHPRLFVRASELADIRKRVAHNDFEQVRKAFETQKKL